MGMFSSWIRRDDGLDATSSQVDSSESRRESSGKSTVFTASMTPTSPHLTDGLRHFIFLLCMHADGAFKNLSAIGFCGRRAGTDVDPAIRYDAIGQHVWLALSDDRNIAFQKVYEMIDPSAIIGT
jgi:hypothetical protein